MSIIQNIDESIFVSVFDEWNRSENFSVCARRALFAYLDELSDDTGEDIQLDVIALCCEWAEYPTVIEAAEEYGKTFEDEDDPEETALEWLRNRTTVIEHDAGILMAQF